MKAGTVRKAAVTVKYKQQQAFKASCRFLFSKCSAQCLKLLCDGAKCSSASSGREDKAQSHPSDWLILSLR